MIAIIITIMVLEMKVPHGINLNSLKPMLPVILSYILSYIYVGIHWNNHHHLFQATKRVDGAIMWANLHLLFWLSLIPFVTGWMGENHVAPVPTALYGFVLLMAGVAYLILQTSIVRDQGRDSVVAAATGHDLKGKLTLVSYGAGICLSFVAPWAACAVYVIVALIWLVPDRRIKRVLTESSQAKQ